MKNSMNYFKPLMIGGALFVLLGGQATQADAWTSQWKEPSNHHDHGNADHQTHAKVISPRTSVYVDLGGVRFYYDDGVYYRRQGSHYYQTVPPIGATIHGLPGGCRSIYRNGIRYYTYNNVYYQSIGGGYRIVDPVVVTPVVLQPTVTYAPTALVQDSFFLNIPSKKGGYVEVALKKSGAGFVGPQGEFYSDFPSVEQLQLMYAK